MSHWPATISGRSVQTALLVVFAVVLAGCTEDASGGPDGAADAGADAVATSGLPAVTGDAATDARNAVNFFRLQAGLGEVTVDEALNVGCQAHVRYMATNGILSHDEDLALPEASPEGNEAGLQSNVASGMPNMVRAVERWIEGVYHRIPVLDPRLRRIGAAQLDGYACLNVLGGREQVDGDWEPVEYPAAGQRDVPRTFDGDETPDPLVVPGYPVPTGYIVSLQFAPGTVVDTSTTATLWRDTIPQESFLQLPNDPDDPNRASLPATLFVVPREPLSRDAEYRVTVSGVVDGEPYAAEWTFQTIR